MEKNNKKELEVAALQNGTVIDHIPADKLFKVVRLLGLNCVDNSITIGNNLVSQRLGKKGIIKVADLFFQENEINKIAIIAPSAKINVIRNYEVIEKKNVTLPDELINIVRCNNPKCITNNEPMRTRFFRVNEEEGLVVKCHYCGHAMNENEIETL